MSVGSISLARNHPLWCSLIALCACISLRTTPKPRTFGFFVLLFSAVTCERNHRHHENYQNPFEQSLATQAIQGTRQGTALMRNLGKQVAMLTHTCNGNAFPPCVESASHCRFIGNGLYNAHLLNSCTNALYMQVLVRTPPTNAGGRC